MFPIKHWQDAVNALVGVWLIMSPWLLGFDAETLALGNALLVGVAIVATAFGATLVPRAWEEWTELVLGLWLIASPWVLGFSAIAAAMFNAVAVGVVIALLSAWVLLADNDYSAGWRKPTTR